MSRYGNDLEAKKGPPERAFSGFLRSRYSPTARAALMRPTP
ncbi:MAG TPA: hypothetical protein VFZ04_09970 [Longimicrobiales bacterium]